MRIERAHFSNGAKALVMGGLSLAIAGSMVAPTPGIVSGVIYGDADSGVESAYADTVTGIQIDQGDAVTAYDSKGKKNGKIRCRINYRAYVKSQTNSSATISIYLRPEYKVTQTGTYYSGASQVTEGSFVRTKGDVSSHKAGAAVGQWTIMKGCKLDKDIKYDKKSKGQTISFKFSAWLQSKNGSKSSVSATVKVNVGAATKSQSSIDKDAAAKVQKMINNLSNTSSESDVRAARSAFGGLSSAQQALVDIGNLTDQETRIEDDRKQAAQDAQDAEEQAQKDAADAADAAAAQRVQDEVNALIGTTPSQSELSRVYSDYFNLSPTQRSLVDLTPYDEAKERRSDADQEAKDAQDAAEQAAQEARDKAEQEAKEAAEQAAQEAREAAEKAEEEARAKAEKEEADNEAAAQVLFQAADLAAMDEPTQDDIDEVKTAYRALTADQRSIAKDQTESAISRAQSIYDANVAVSKAVQKQIKTLSGRSSADAVQKARDAYDGLTDFQQGLVDTYNLETQESRIEQEQEAAEEKAEADQEAADAVSDSASSLDANDEPTQDDIDQVREAYSGLTRDQRALVTGYDSAISGARAKLAARKAVAAGVQKQIGSLTSRSTADEVSAARTAYDSLTEEQQGWVTTTNLERQESRIEQEAEQAEADQEAASGVQGSIDQLAENPTPTSDDLASVREAYSGLTSSQRKLLKGYDDAVSKAVNYLRAQQDKVDAVQQQIGDLDASSSKADVQAARKAYNQLDSSLRDQVDTANLETQEERLENDANTATENKQAAASVTSLVNKLSKMSSPTQDDVDEVRDAYDALTPDQQELVVGYEAAIEKATSSISDKEAQVASVQSLIDALDSDSTKAQCQAARKAYQALSPSQKESVDTSNLETQEERISNAEEESKQQKAEDESAASEVSSLVEDLASNDAPSSEDIAAVKEAYRGLTASQKKLVKGYDAAIAKANSYVAGRKTAAASVQKQIDALDDSSSKALVSAARRAYNSLPDELKDSVTTSNLETQEERVEQEAQEAKEKAEEERQKALEKAEAEQEAKNEKDQAAAESRAAVDQVQQLLDDLKAMDSPGEDDIENVTSAYAELTASQKKQVKGYSAAINAARKGLAQNTDSDDGSDPEDNEEDAPSGSYTVTVYANDGSGTQLGHLTWDIDDTYQAPAISDYGYERPGLRFTGWNTKADGSGDSYDELASVSNLTDVSGGKARLYAQWEAIGVDSNGNDVSGDHGKDPGKQSGGSTVTPSKPGTSGGKTAPGSKTDAGKSDSGKPAVKKASKKSQKLKAFPSKSKVSYKKAKKKAQKVTIWVTGAKGKVTYKKARKGGIYKKVSVSKSGKVTFKKGAKKGTYKFAVKANATKGYKASKSKTVTVKVK